MASVSRNVTSARQHGLRKGNTVEETNVDMEAPVYDSVEEIRECQLYTTLETSTATPKVGRKRCKIISCKNMFLLFLTATVIGTLALVIFPYFAPGSTAKHGKWTSWSDWSSCSVTCGVGLEKRHRNCTKPLQDMSGRPCPGDSVDVTICMAGPCADGGWSSWGSWDSCSNSCGGGVKSRLRTCTNPKPSLLGRYCDGSPEQVTPCNKSPCPDRKVAFTAHGIFVNGSSIRFPIADQNYGGGYSTSTGKFTCPVAGIYHFAVTLTKEYGVNVDRVFCFLYINLLQKLGTEEDPYNRNDGDDKGSYSLTITGTFHLNRTDVVFIDNCGGTSALLNNIESSFTGFLVLPDN